MNHPSKISIGITLIASIAIVWSIVALRSNTSTTVSPQTQPSITTEQWPSYEVDRKTRNDSNQYYSIDVVYPITKSVAINDTFTSFVEDQILQFKEDTAWVTDPAIDSASKGTLSLSIAYTEQKSAIADTYIFTSTIYTGGAHGLQVTKTFTFDQYGAPITINDLFAKPDAGLKAVASFVQNEITKKNISDPQWIADGAGANVENYQSFVFGTDGVTFIFDPYQVAPYAVGTQNILVPFSIFKNFANPKLIIQ